jgi:hypothetical protein
MTSAECSAGLASTPQQRGESTFSQPWARPPQRLWIASDSDHTARATQLARIALAGRGIRIQSDPPPPSSPGGRRKLVRDALRLSLWRTTGSTGGWLVPQTVARKRAQCGL